MIAVITLSEYIKKLQAIEAEHGEDLPVIEYIDEYDGYGNTYEDCDEPELIISKIRGVPYNKAVLIA